MTLAEAEDKYPYLLMCSFLDLIMVEMEHVNFLAKTEDKQVAEDLEAIRLIKKSRMGDKDGKSPTNPK